MQIYLSGSFVDEKDAKVSVFDHGLLYGDGIFEGMRLYNKCIFRLDEHLERLEYSARAILLNMPWSRQEIAELTAETCRRNNLIDGYIRLLVTRGKGKLGISPSSCKNPELIIIADKIQLYPESAYRDGLKIVTSPTRRISNAALPPNIKSLNYLNNVLAKAEAERNGYMEAIMLNDAGYISECTADNIFLINKKRVYTPQHSDGALKGITRMVVFEVCKELGIEIISCNLTRYDAWTSDECFLTGSAAEIIPVTEIDGRVISGGQAGPLTQKILAKFREKTTQQGYFI